MRFSSNFQKLKTTSENLRSNSVNVSINKSFNCKLFTYLISVPLKNNWSRIQYLITNYEQVYISSTSKDNSVTWFSTLQSKVQIFFWVEIPTIA